MSFPTQQTLDQFHGSEAPGLIFLYFLTQLLPLAVAQEPLLAVQRDMSHLLGDTQLYMVALGAGLPCFPPLTLLVCSHPGQAAFQCWTESWGDNAALGTRGRCHPAVTHSEAQSAITCGLFTSSLNAATSCGLFLRLKPLQAVFLARAFFEKWSCQRRARAMGPAQTFSPDSTPKLA